MAVNFILNCQLKKKHNLEVLRCSVTQLCPTLCDHMDCSPSGSSVHRIFQARVLEWVVISYLHTVKEND